MMYPKILGMVLVMGLSVSVIGADANTASCVSQRLSALATAITESLESIAGAVGVQKPHSAKVVIQNNTGRSVISAAPGQLLYTSEGQFDQITLEDKQLLVLQQVPSMLYFSPEYDKKKRGFPFAGFNVQDKKELDAGKKHAWVVFSGFAWGDIEWGDVESSTQFIPHDALPELLDPTSIQMDVRNRQEDTIILSTSPGQMLLTKKGARKEITLTRGQSMYLEQIPSDLYFSFKNDANKQLFKIDSAQKQNEHPVDSIAGRRRWAILVEIGRHYKGPKKGELDIYMGNVVRDWR